MKEKWSDLQKLCYQRNCDCYECPVFKALSSTKRCLVKKSLIEKIRKFGLDAEVETKYIIADE